MQHSATWLHDVVTCAEWAGQTHTFSTFSTFSMEHVDVNVSQAPGGQRVELAHIPLCNSVAWTWSTEYNIMQHPKCCTKNDCFQVWAYIIQHTLQHIATGLPNVCNMLCPNMLQDVAVKMLWTFDQAFILGYYCLMFGDFFLEFNLNKTKLVQATGSPILGLHWVMLKNDGRFIWIFKPFAKELQESFTKSCKLSILL